MTGVWRNTATVVTSLDIVASVASAIKTGARFVLFRRTATNLRADAASTYERTVSAGIQEGTETTEYTTGAAVYGGSVIGVSALLQDNVTAGTITVNVKVEGSTVLSTVLSAGNPRKNSTRTTIGTQIVAAGDEITVEVITSGYTNAGSVTSGLVVQVGMINSALIAQPALTTTRKVDTDANDLLVYDGTTSSAGATLVNSGSAGSGDLTRSGTPVHDTVGLLDVGIRNTSPTESFWEGASAVEPTSLTLSMWIKPQPGGDSFQVLFFKRFQSGTTWSTPFISIGMRITSARLIEGYLATSGSHVNLFSSAPATWMATVDNKVWSHVGVTFDGGTFVFKGYINGELIASSTLSGAIDYGANNVWNVLANGSSASESFVGDMEDIRLADVVRSADWFKDVWRRGLGLI
jgi:hypothetical protein